MFARSATLVTAILVQCWTLQAHLAVWTTAMYGQDRGNGNSNAATIPLRDLTYKDKPEDVLPGDFSIFSVVYDCPARQLQSFDIPSLPPCPNGRCHCSWL